ncbi:hypothetical protein L6452_44361 [Arctium lappa]|uniref:Uncharacterized protein n=1 Tax=Arctium lappa TaxID=4217 RepID=A0ACB8XFY9_ARCLA|nr:hypothetical protein L6452_44361 [Arctium lappa]
MGRPDLATRAKGEWWLGAVAWVVMVPETVSWWSEAVFLREWDEKDRFENGRISRRSEEKVDVLNEC